MDDRAVCQWAIDQRTVVNEFTDAAAVAAKPGRQQVFEKLIAVNKALVELFWEINIAREREHLEPLAHPHD